jgi:hypothetical protein
MTTARKRAEKRVGTEIRKAQMQRQSLLPMIEARIGERAKMARTEGMCQTVGLVVVTEEARKPQEDGSVGTTSPQPKMTLTGKAP